MSIPYNDKLSWACYSSRMSKQNPLADISESESSIDRDIRISSMAIKLLLQTPKELVVRGIQFIRDAARLVLKVPIRSVWTPIVLQKNWKQRERAKINAKLTGYSFVQLVSVPAKFLVALAAIATMAFSLKQAKWLLETSENWTAQLDGRASQLEALKEEGQKNTLDPKEYNKYKDWVYTIDAKLCRKEI